MRAGGTDFSARPELVAPQLLGWTIACRGTAAVVCEVEAYHQDEPAAHSFGGLPTPRTRDLFGPPGTLYVYRSYGIHWCANVVTGVAGSGEAVLLRAAIPVHGAAAMRARRGERVADRDLLAGPGRLAQGLGLTGADSGARVVGERPVDLDDIEQPVVFRDPALAERAGIQMPVAPGDLLVGPRIGITKAVDLPWRFGVRGVRLSRPFR